MKNNFGGNFKGKYQKSGTEGKSTMNFHSKNNINAASNINKQRQYRSKKIYIREMNNASRESS